MTTENIQAHKTLESIPKSPNSKVLFAIQFGWFMLIISALGLKEKDSF